MFPFVTRRKYAEIEKAYLTAKENETRYYNEKQGLSAELCEVQRRIVSLMHFAGTREAFNDELLQLMIFINKTED